MITVTRNADTTCLLKNSNSRYMRTVEVEFMEYLHKEKIYVDDIIDIDIQVLETLYEQWKLMQFKW